MTEMSITMQALADLRARAEAAEAKVARVEAALDEWGMDDDDNFAEAIQESGAWRLARDIRAALNSDA